MTLRLPGILAALLAFWLAPLAAAQNASVLAENLQRQLNVEDAQFRQSFFANTPIADRLLTLLRSRIDDCFGADPLRSPDLGSIVNQAQYDRLNGLLEGARQRGQLLHGGACEPGERRIAPSLIQVEGPEDPLMQEELFGPLLPVLVVEDLEEAIQLINRRPKPLALYLFTSQRQHQRTLLQRTSSGGVCLNDVVLQAGVPELVRCSRVR